MATPQHLTKTQHICKVLRNALRNLRDLLICSETFTWLKTPKLRWGKTIYIYIFGPSTPDILAALAFFHMLYRAPAIVQAGASIVANNMQGLESAGVNAMVAGVQWRAHHAELGVKCKVDSIAGIIVSK